MKQSDTSTISLPTGQQRAVSAQWNATSRGTFHCEDVSCVYCSGPETD
ncbi:hypothetical protein [Sinomonas mesophila]|nr:hypothetical protein [Sinomonas mesophila]